MTTKERIESIGDVSVKLTSDYENGEYIDAKVEINAGDEINAVIDCFRI